MFAFHSRCAIPLAAMLVWLAPVRATDLDPKALTYKLPSQITSVENKTAGNAIAVLAGDPNKPGLYVIFGNGTPTITAAPTSIPTTGS